MRNVHCRTWNMARNIEKRKKLETHIIGHGIWREIVKNVKNEKYTLQDMEYSKKNEKHGK